MALALSLQIQVKLLSSCCKLVLSCNIAFNTKAIFMPCRIRSNGHPFCPDISIYLFWESAMPRALEKYAYWVTSWKRLFNRSSPFQAQTVCGEVSEWACAEYLIRQYILIPFHFYCCKSLTHRGTETLPSQREYECSGGKCYQGRDIY